MSAKRIAHLSLEVVKQRVAAVEGWEIVKTEGNSDAIRASYKFKSFEDTWAFLTKVAMRAHLEGHHPHITNVYNKVDLELTTHDVGGLSELDFKMAKRFTKYAMQFNN